ncbi:MAG: DegQ family serine endoprotease [Planctomycetaceae bacterium]
MKQNWVAKFIRNHMVSFVLIFVGGLLMHSTAVPQPASRSDEQKHAQNPGIASASELERAFTKAIARAEQSVVSIARVRRMPPQRVVPENAFFPRINSDRDNPASVDFIPSEFGSGIIVAPLTGKNDRFILTNYHVVKGGPAVKQNAPDSKYRLYVRLANRRGYYAKILAADPRSDLAVLTIDYAALRLKPEELEPIQLATQEKFQKGQMVLALGNPYAQARDGSASVSWGIISNISRRPKPAGETPDLATRKKETIHHYGTLLQVDTRLNLGTSGGALINLRGELIGITTSLAALDGYEKSVGYAVPMDRATRRVVQTLARGQAVEYGFLGVSPQDISPQEVDLLPKTHRRQFAAMAASVHPGAPGARAGLQTGDIILAVDDVPIRSKYELMREIGQQPPESKTKLKVWRQSIRRELELTAKLGKWPVLNHEEIIASNPRFPEWRGLTVDYPTGHYRYLQRPYRYHRAVLLTQLKNRTLVGNPRFTPGVFISHVNGIAVETPREFHSAVQELTGPVKLRLIGGETITVPE